MPANLTPEYYKAEKWFRSAASNEEKLLALEEMLRVIPKHKGTDHMRAELRKKLSRLKESPAKKSGGHVDIFHVPKSGAGQVVLLGMPNSGKSSLLALLTNANVTVAEFPFSTSAAVPGMVKYEDIQIELVDMPPITADIMLPGQVGAYRNCDMIAIVIDVSADVEEQYNVLLDFLQSRRLLIDSETEPIDEHGNNLGRKALVLCTKMDAAKEGAVNKVIELVGGRFEILNISTESMEGVEGFAAGLFKLLDIIRVYSKKPGKDADMTDPFTLTAGSTVIDLSKTIHKELVEKLKSARIWGTGVHGGQQVQRNHVLCDKDIVELHFI